MAKADMPQDYKTIAAQWVAGQPFTNVLLVAILSAGGWCGYYAITIAIPAHLQTIQNGYERLDEMNRSERDRIDRQHSTERETIRRQFEGWLDRIENMRGKVGSSQSPPVSLIK